ncbi:evolutionarily conserved signaling intermediate in toll pathway domain-containing protein [Ditylenchus destructor]|uniref:Evolutionarily conserved signaling intermediate in Toll pathway, mitochondrial n=1 Tax=Ditylenchus destructor TaxID=166010 RepID=A0AAD4N3N0_9BILA|nr:evolutionarily conserved signaling intermediate in toll pathway domain-containing protein [Ditylenchus destructor]
MRRFIGELPVLLRRNFVSAEIDMLSGNKQPTLQHISRRYLVFNKPRELNMKQLQEIDDEFEKIPHEDRTKLTFLKHIEIFKQTRGRRNQGHVEYIRSAMKNMETYGLHKDLDVYKALLDIFPKGYMIPKNQFQRAFIHFPDQQVCAVKLFDQMEWHNVYPDQEFYSMVVAIFGEWNYATKKVNRMFYWMPRLKNTNKYLDWRKVDNQHLKDAELARIALQMICRDAGTVFTYVKTPATEHEFGKWIVSAQSPLQRKVIRNMEPNSCYFVDGPFFVWVREKKLEYCVLSASPVESEDEEFIDPRSVYDYSDPAKDLYVGEDPNGSNLHHQSDQIILALSIMEETTQNIGSAWVNHLQTKNPMLEKASILLRIKEKVTTTEIKPISK